MKGYRDPKSTVIQDWKWRPLRKVQEGLDLTEIPSHVQKFGEFMDETARRASIHGLTPRDLVKAYTITRFSMQRTARKALILRKAGLILPSGIDDQEKIRPEGAFGHWLHTKHGQRYLDKAEAGEVDEEAIDDAKQKLRTFGKVDKDLPDALRWAPKNLPGREARVSELVARALRRQSTPEEWRGEMSNLKGIKAAKAGFIAAQLGRGDQPTLDARQLIEHTGEPSKVSTKYLNRSGGLGAAEGVQRLAARQTAMDLSLPKEQQHNYQHLAHHAFWDKAADEVTTHEDVMGAMRGAKDGGRIERARGGGTENADLHPLLEGLARAGLPGYGHLLKNVPHERLKKALSSIHSPFSDEPEDVQAALRVAESLKVPTKAPGARLQTEVPYYGVKQSTWPEDVFTKIDPLRGTTLKAKQQKTWEDLYNEGKGGHFINLAGDRSRSGVLTHVMGRKLAWPVKLYAGPEYMREYNPGSVWASAKGVSSNLDKITKELSRGDKPVYGIYQPMGAKSADSAHHMFDALMAQVPGSGIDKDMAAKFDEMVKAGLHMDLAKRPRVVKMMEKWPGIMNAKEASKFARTLPGAQRSAMVKMMDQAPWLKAGFPAVGMTRVAITDPEVMNAPGNMIGHRYVQLDPDRKAREKVPHTTYTAPTAGTYGGELPLVQRQYATPDQTFSNMMKDISGGRIVHPYSSDNYGRGTARDMYDKTKVVQPITQEWLDNLEAGRARQAKYGLASGGRVRRAMGGSIDDDTKQWFGDSKVVDAQGQPLIVYRGEHGDNPDSTTFHTRMPRSITFGSREIANAYAETPNDTADTPAAPRMTPAYVKIRKPVVHAPDDPFVDLADIEAKLGRKEALRVAHKHSMNIENTNNWREDINPHNEYLDVADYLKKHPDGLRKLFLDVYPVLDDPEFVRAAVAKGYDGAIHLGHMDAGTGNDADNLEYRIFHPKQARSAISPHVGWRRQRAGGGEVDETKGIIDTVRGALTPDLLTPTWRDKVGDKPKCASAGHCYAATEAAYHMLGGPSGDYGARVLTSKDWPKGLDEGETHWYLAHKKTGKVIDPTYDQFDGDVPYHKGRGIGFLTKQPSKRAQTIIERASRPKKADGGEVDDPAQWYEQHQAQLAKTDGTGDLPPVQQPTPGIGHNQPPGPTSYIKPVDEDKRRLTPLGFYSHAAEAVWKQPMMKASPAQFKSTLLNKHGVKPDEFKWSGYDEAFKDRPMVTKKEVRDHFVKNLPNIQEATKRDKTNEYGDKYGRDPDDDSWEETQYSDYQLPGGKNYRELVLHMPRPDHPDLGKAKQAHREALAARGAAAQEKVRAAAAANEMVSRKASDDELNAARTRMTEAFKAHRAAQEHAEKTDADVKNLNRQNNYKSLHWDEKNPLLHLRVSDRAGPEVAKYQWVNRTSGNGTRKFDSEDEANQHLERLPEKLRPDLYLRKVKQPQKILHVEEMQSDWGQDARDKGFVEDREARKQQVFEAERRLNVAHQLGKPDAEKAAAQAELDKLLDAQAEEKGAGVPSAPYIDKTGKWTELGLKRILHEAATGGYDRIVFTPGSEQAKRYDLTNHISDLMVQDVGNNRIDMSYRQHGSHDFSGSQEMHPKELGNHIGKELADKIMAQKPDAGGYRHMSGLDLKVGGEGMKGFYDKIVPTALEKLARQHDPEARVQPHSFKVYKGRSPDDIDRELAEIRKRRLSGERPEDHQRFNELSRERLSAERLDHVPLHALDITPKMRNSIRKGQRAYAGGGRVGRAMAGSVDMGSTPYSTSVISPGAPATPGAPADGGGSRGFTIADMASSGSGGVGGSPGDEKEFLRMIAGPSGADDITRTVAAGMLASGNYTFSGQTATRPTPVARDPNAPPDYPVNRADGGAVTDPVPPPAAPADDYQRQVSPVGLYSHAAEAVWKQPQMKASPQQFKAMLLNKHGVKPDEFKWTGYDQAFDGRDYVTKREVRDHFQQNMPQVQEQVRSGFDYGHTMDYDNDTSNMLAPKYGQWQLPGGDNYREVLLHLPEQKTNSGVGLGLPPGARDNVNYHTSHWDVPNVLAHLRMSDRTEDPPGARWQVEKAGGTWKPKKILHVEEVQSDWGQEARDKGIVQPGAVPEGLSIKEGRTTGGGQYFEVIDQRGRTVGWHGTREGALADAMARRHHTHANTQPIGVPDAPYIGTSDKWTDLALKRVLHEAATGNYDKVVFTNGRDQAERYDLSKQVSKIRWRHRPDDPDNSEYGGLTAYDHDGNVIIQKDGLHVNELAGHIGKETADKLLNAKPVSRSEHGREERILEGQNIKVGGEGMHQYYDKQLPKRLEKLARMHDPKADVKLYSHKMPKPLEGGVSGVDVMNDLGVDRDAQDTYWRALNGPMREQHMQEYRRRRANDSYALHALEVTPQMRASILKGQRGFAAGGKVSERINERVYQKVRKVVPVTARYP